MSALAVRALRRELRRMGHVVGEHRLPPRRPTRAAPGRNHRGLVTFHSPGVPLRALAALSDGEHICGPIVDARVTYRSDSMGRWRWGEPSEHAEQVGLRLHLLVRPRWWFPSPDVSRELHDSEVARQFLPRVAREDRPDRELRESVDVLNGSRERIER